MSNNKTQRATDAINTADLPVCTGLKADQGIELLLSATPNGIECSFQALYLLAHVISLGHKASIFLEELKEAYNLEYTYQGIELPKGVHKMPWYLELNYNGKIPTIVDHGRNGLSVSECSGE